MNIALIGYSCLVLAVSSAAGVSAVDEPKAGRSMLEVPDQEILDAYWWNWRSAVTGPVGVRWRWNLDETGAFWSQGDELEGDLETRVKRFQQRLDQLWAERDEQGQDSNSILIAFGFAAQGIEQLDPDKDRVFDPVVEFRNGRELISVTDIQIVGDQITMVFPGGKGRIVAQENEKAQLVGSWTTADAMGKPQEFEFIGHPWYNIGCGTNGVFMSKEMVKVLDGSWVMEFDTLGVASCEFDVLSLDGNQYEEDWYEGIRLGVPQEYSYVIANITTARGELNNLIGSVRPFRRDTGEDSFKMSLLYFDGEQTIRIVGELEDDGSLVGTMSSSKFGEDTWIGRRGESNPRLDDKNP